MLRRVDERRQGLAGGDRLQLDRLAECSAQQLCEARNELPDIGQLCVESLPSANGEEPVGELFAVIGRILSLA